MGKQKLYSLRRPDGIPELTKREKQILQLLSQGNKSSEIADILYISLLTVKTHRATTPEIANRKSSHRYQ